MIATVIPGWLYFLAVVASLAALCLLVAMLEDDRR